MHFPRHATPFLLLLASACPERTVPERGVQLLYRKATTDSVRTVVDRRLAQLKLKANLHEDDSTLSVRVPEGGDLGPIKSLLARSGHLEFCPEDETIAEPWCARAWAPPVTTNRGDTTCALLAPTRAQLELALGDAGVPLAFGTDGDQATVYALREDRCLTPRVVNAEPKPSGLMLEFDRPTGRAFAELTKDTVGHRLIIRLEGVVTSAPVVREPITGGRAMITSTPKDDLPVLGALLVGGTLPALTLEKEAPYGPPSLR